MSPKENSDESMAALAALYAAERADTGSLLNTNVAIVVAQFAYLSAAVAFEKDIAKLSPLIAAVAPLPLWVAALYNGLLGGVMARHGKSVEILEKMLFVASGIPYGRRNDVGARSGEVVFNPKKGKFLQYRIGWIALYATPAVVIPVYTAYVLIVHLGSIHITLTILLAIFYFAWFLLVTTIGLTSLMQSTDLE